MPECFVGSDWYEAAATPPIIGGDFKAGISSATPSTQHYLFGRMAIEEAGSTIANKRTERRRRYLRQDEMTYASITPKREGRRPYRPRTCSAPRCTELLHGRRKNTKFCSPACRKRTWALKQKPGREEERRKEVEAAKRRCARNGCSATITGRGLYCTDACKQAAYRRRKMGTLFHFIETGIGEFASEDWYWCPGCRLNFRVLVGAEPIACDGGHLGRPAPDRPKLLHSVARYP